MKYSLGIPRRMLEIEKLNYGRQCCSLASLVAVTAIFMLLAVSQSGAAKWLGKHGNNFWITIDFIAVLMAALSLICGIVVVFHIERQKRKIREKIESEARRRGFRSRIEEEKAHKKLIDKFSDVMEKYANGVDLFGSVCNFTLQMSAITLLLAHGVALGEHIKFGTVGLSIIHVVDFISNTAYFLSAMLFCTSHMIMHRNTKEFSKNLVRQTQIMVLLVVGNLLVWGGKIIVAMESIGKIVPAQLPTGGTIPLGWATRSIGMLLCVASFCMIMASTSKKCEELEKLVESSDGARETVTMLSTHDVRSCFGYFEHGGKRFA
ncbi:hypothetical protein [Candidatus Anaplasma sp. TIGMIC]|uniref:hypothetical protein n=1 Tax=Candidatus Anaplasma sp. TIGMIC TaxID=3020713 RepID=UPI002330896E|nr:hypothetical protein [Candidatus Anaplasma sp. TIGMIC]MDB1135660.1 hypothetical protein [Candidatus Anaplasma sp. TIGMIC]